jgi:hypothetical protein
LNPERMGGQNIGASSKRNDPGARTAADIDVLAGRLSDFTRDELSQIPITPAGTKLKQGAVYLDMRIPAAVPFAATADIKATEMNYYAPKADIPYQLRDRLVAAWGRRRWEKRLNETRRTNRLRPPGRHENRL